MLKKIRVNLFIGLTVLLIFTGLVSAVPSEVAKKTIPYESLEKSIEAELFQPNFAHGDCSYTGLIAASNGRVYFSVGTHNTDYASRFYSFDQKKKKITLIAKMDEALGEDIEKQYSHGKIHTRMFEHKGKIWFAVHTAYYDNDLPGMDITEKQTAYQGGHFMNYDIKSGKFTDLAQIFPNEGIITLTMDKENEIMYGLTWPSALLVSYDIKNDDIRYWGSVQTRGEWGHRGNEWEMVCRTLGIDSDNYVYGSTMFGKIWKYDPAKPRRVGFIDGLDLSKVPFSQSSAETLKGDFRNNWRTVEWNEKTKSFWGLHFETTTLFEFVPSANYIRAVTQLAHEDYFGMPRNPEISQLGFTIGPKNTIFYLAHGPAIKIKGREDVRSSLNLITYEIDKAKYTNHGAIFSADKRRVFFGESIAIGTDDHIYSVAWVEVVDPVRAKSLQQTRADGTPAETKEMVYEMMLIRLPKWQNFINSNEKSRLIQKKGDQEMEIKITSSAFTDGGMIPSKYTCDGKDMSPDLSWQGVPQDTKSIALICDDPDAPMGTFVHWVLFNLPADTTQLPENYPEDETLGDGVRQGITDFGKTGYGGPCPPSGTHRYFFKIYALDTVIDMVSLVDKPKLLEAMDGHILAQGQLMGKYKRR